MLSERKIWLVNDEEVGIILCAGKMVSVWSSGASACATYEVAWSLDTGHYHFVAYRE